MKLSIWRQFSSNHSGNFTIIGRFSTAEEAEIAAAKIRDIWLQIADWREANFTADGQWKAYWNGDITVPLEEKFSSEVGIAWNPKNALEWTRQKKDIDDTVFTFENSVILTSAGETWHFPEPYVAYLRNQNCDVFTSYKDYLSIPNTIITTTLTANAPSVEIAQFIQEHVNAHLLMEQPTVTPWAAYHRGQRHPLADCYDFAIGKPLNGCELTKEQMSVIRTITYDSWAYIGKQSKGMARNEKVFEIQELVFVDAEYGLPAVVAWLESMGCTVEYEFGECKEADV